LGGYASKLLRLIYIFFSQSSLDERGEPPEAGPAGKFFFFKSGELYEMWIPVLLSPFLIVM